MRHRNGESSPDSGRAPLLPTVGPPGNDKQASPWPLGSSSCTPTNPANPANPANPTNQINHNQTLPRSLSIIHPSTHPEVYQTQILLYEDGADFLSCYKMKLFISMFQRAINHYAFQNYQGWNSSRPAQMLGPDCVLVRTSLAALLIKVLKLRSPSLFLPVPGIIIYQPPCTPVHNSDPL